jgi:hypothetical protein
LETDFAEHRENLGDDPASILEKMKLGGPVARSLFGLQPTPTNETLKTFIHQALKDDLFSFGTQSMYDTFLIQPLVVGNVRSGLPHLQRTDYCAEFLSPFIVQATFDLAQLRLEKLQNQLSEALNISTTRSVAGKFVEGLMHRALTRDGIKLPAHFGAATTVELIGKPRSFISTSPTSLNPRPLYLRPQSSNFAAVDAILVTNDKTGFIQTSLGETHPCDIGMMLRIFSRLRGRAHVTVNASNPVLYCLVGTRSEHVSQLVKDATQTLETLQALGDKALGKELGIRGYAIAHKRLSEFQVVGYTFDSTGFNKVENLAAVFEPFSPFITL